MEINKIIQGDCLEVLKTFPDNSVDSVVTDPPYGIGFMGKEWDTFKLKVLNEGIAKSSRKKSYLNPERSKDARKGGSPAWESARYNRSLEGNINYQNWYTEIMRECCRVLKPGGHILSCCGTRTYHRMAVGVEDAGFEIRDIVAWLYGSGFPKSLDIGKAMDKLQDNSDWKGWGTALKPAMELWVLGRKPLNEKTVVENILKYGTGGINIKSSRVGIEKHVNTPSGKTDKYAQDKWSKNNQMGSLEEVIGRWPANLIHDGLQEPWARFFYTAKASKVDRNQGLEDREAIMVTDGNIRKNSDSARKYQANSALRKNIHPTVKPTDLMRYLVKLITPPNGIVLDPFMGSGSTGKAAVLEGFNYVGIEREAEYIEIAEARIKAAQKQQVLNF